MNFLRRVRYFSTSDVKIPSPSSYFKEHAQTILTAVTISAGIFAAGAYSVQTAAEIKVLKAKIHDSEEKGRIALEGQIKIYEERIKTTEERIKTAKEEAKKEALERLFNVINQAEYDSAKKAIQEIPIQKNVVK
jgi:hypothetical protein